MITKTNFINFFQQNKKKSVSKISLNLTFDIQWRLQIFRGNIFFYPKQDFFYAFFSGTAYKKHTTHSVTAQQLDANFWTSINRTSFAHSRTSFEYPFLGWQKRKCSIVKHSIDARFRTYQERCVFVKSWTTSFLIGYTKGTFWSVRRHKLNAFFLSCMNRYILKGGPLDVRFRTYKEICIFVQSFWISIFCSEIKMYILISNRTSTECTFRKFRKDLYLSKVDVFWTSMSNTR